jgi:hypothetical protein
MPAPKNDWERLTERVQIYLTPGESADLRARAYRAKRSLAGFTRDLVVGVLDAEKRHAKEGEAHG